MGDLHGAAGAALRGEPARYDGVDGDALASLLGVPEVVALASVASTMDVAHERAKGGAPAGTVVLADQQTRGRGRGGRTWSSPPGLGLWMTVLERPVEPSGIDVLSLRVGLAAAAVLDGFSDISISLKWPNDLFVGAAKVGGILVETRWREMRIEWVAMGIGIDLHPIPGTTTASLRANTGRIDLARALVPALRVAASQRGELSAEEIAEYDGRDRARGRRCSAPVPGSVLGITARGELRIASAEGITLHRDGSLLLEEST